jgi:hypothetical protein
MNISHSDAVRRDIGLTFDFIRACANDPALLEQMEQFEDGTELVFVEKDQPFPQLKEGAKQQFIKVSRAFEVVDTIASSGMRDAQL